VLAMCWVATYSALQNAALRAKIAVTRPSYQAPRLRRPSPTSGCQGGFLGQLIGYVLGSLVSGPGNPYPIAITAPGSP